MARLKGTALSVIQGIFTKGEQPILGLTGWERGVSEIIRYEDAFHGAVILEILPAEQKSFEEVHDQVVEDYQDTLITKWEKELQNRYPVILDEQVLSILIRN